MHKAAKTTLNIWLKENATNLERNRKPVRRRLLFHSLFRLNQSSSLSTASSGNRNEAALIVFGLINAFIALAIFPEIFASAAIILGAFAWREEKASRSYGLIVIILGILCAFIGIYFTSYFELGDLFY